MSNEIKDGAAPVLTEAQRAALAQVLELVHHDDIEHPDQSAASILRPLLVTPAPSPEPAEAAPAGAEPLGLDWVTILWEASKAAPVRFDHRVSAHMLNTFAQAIRAALSKVSR